MADLGGIESPKPVAGRDANARESAPATDSPANLFPPSTILSIADSLPVMVAYCDRDQVYRFCNKPIADWFERPRQDILGHTVREVMGEASYALRRDKLEAALNGERIFFSAAFDHPTRGPMTTQAEYIPHLDDRGTVTGVIMVVQDITEQRAAEVALRESEARFRRIADSAPVPMWVSRLDGTRDFVNEKYAEFMGVSIDEARRSDWRSNLHPDDVERMERDAEVGKASGGIFRLEARFLHADGDYRWMRSVLQPRRGDDGQVLGHIGVATDVTREKADEAELKRRVEETIAELALSESRFRAMFNTVSASILLLSPEGRILAVNQTGGRWRERGREPREGEFVWDAGTASDEQRAVVRQMAATAAHGEPVQHEFEVVGPTGEHFVLDCSMRPIVENGVVRYLLLEVRDVSELKHAQDQLRQSQKMEALGQLTGGIAHDFNNLLTVIVGGLDLIVKKVDDERVLLYARNALSSAERGARLTAQLLAFSRVQRLEVRPCVVADTIEEMKPLLRNVVGPGVTLDFPADADRPTVMADPTQLEVAMLNLAINARDAMPDGGTLTVTTRHLSVADDAELDDGEYVELSIADTGAGMPEEVRLRAFEPFFTTKDVGKGTGLGLSMVYGMARQSGGTARIDSRAGEGTTVSLLFRRVDDKALAGEGETDQGGSRKPVGALDVLVIDDDDEVRNHIVHSLEDHGHRVRAAADGAAGLLAFAQGPADIVVLDYLMPGLTGADVAAQILADRPGQPILFVSGYSETAAICEAAPSAGVLAKPFRAEALDEAIRDLLARPR